MEGAVDLHSAVLRGDEHRARSLVASLLAVLDARNEAGCSALFLAAERGLSHIVQLLVRAGADVDLGNSAGVTPLMKASWNGHVEAVETLLEFEANVHLRDGTGATALYMASEYGHLPIVERLLLAGAELDAEDGMGASPLFIAAETGFTDVLRVLIAAGGNVDHVMWYSGLTPINTATWCGQTGSVNLLIDACADLTIANKRGFTPLCFGSSKNQTEVLKCLIAAQADLNTPNNAGETPIYVASKSGFVETVAILIAADADVNRPDLAGSRPLHVASRNGHYQISRLLVEAGADVFAVTDRGETALLLACSRLNDKVVKFLLETMSSNPVKRSEVTVACLDLLSSYLDHPTVLKIRSILVRKSDFPFVENELTIEDDCSQLSYRLSAAGFTKKRAQFQAEISRVLEDLCTKCLSLPHYLTGSYGDGWGNNLAFLNGKIGFDSDIDFTRIIPECYHIVSYCRCPRESVANHMTGEFFNGHVTCTVSSSVTAETCLPSRLRPATDYVFAIRCCCYPDVPLLQPGRCGFLPDTLVKALRDEIRAGNPCHLIRAASPGKAGQEMRISTTFLERLCMRSLTTVQGQVFVTLKHLIKNVISKQVKGLKSYHAKTLIFLIVHRTSPEFWKPENLVELTHQALNLLISCLSIESDPLVCMRHFFYPDAPLYCKKNSAPKDKIVACLRSVADNLTEYLHHYQSLLKPLDCEDFYFHPFCLLPLQRVTRCPSLQQFGGQYHQVYACVAELLLRLTPDQGDDSEESNWILLNSLPDYAYTTRECLRVMFQLKSGDQSSARQTLTDRLLHHRVSRNIKFRETSIDDQLLSGDSAWRFIFRIDEGLKLAYLPEFTRKIFPQSLDTYFEFFYFNFDAVVKSLSFELLPSDSLNISSWFQELQLHGPDLVELVTLAEFSNDPSHLEFAHDKLVAMSGAYDDVISAIKDKLVQQLRKAE